MKLTAALALCLLSGSAMAQDTPLNQDVINSWRLPGTAGELMLGSVQEGTMTILPPNSSGSSTSWTALPATVYRPEFVIAGGAITIHPDGRVVLAKGLKLDAASKAFWDAMETAGLKRMACPVDAKTPVSR